MEPSRELRAFRTMAWERAKGELRSMLHTFYTEHDTHDQYKELDNEIEQFIKRVEDNGLHE